MTRLQSAQFSQFVVALRVLHRGVQAPVSVLYWHHVPMLLQSTVDSDGQLGMHVLRDGFRQLVSSVVHTESLRSEHFG